MTGGTVVVLGQTGRNFAAGMSGGVAYVLDEDKSFEKRCNLSMVALEPVPEEVAQSETGELEGHGKVDVRHLGRADEDLLKSLIKQHVDYTGSERAKTILADWSGYRNKFVKVMPNEYRRALTEMAQSKAVEKQKEAA
jgi:glutamate synthase (NADPH/NADH) large chain